MKQFLAGTDSTAAAVTLRWGLGDGGKLQACSIYSPKWDHWVEWVNRSPRFGKRLARAVSWGEESGGKVGDWYQRAGASAVAYWMMLESINKCETHSMGT